MNLVQKNDNPPPLRRLQPRIKFIEQHVLGEIARIAAVFEIQIEDFRRRILGLDFVPHLFQNDRLAATAHTGDDFNDIRSNKGTDQIQIMCAGYHVKGSPTGERHSTISIADEQSQKVDSVGYGRQNRLNKGN